MKTLKGINISLLLLYFLLLTLIVKYTFITKETKENFTQFLELINYYTSTNKDNNNNSIILNEEHIDKKSINSISEPKKIKYIYIGKNNTNKYNFYNKDYKIYIYLIYSEKNYQKNIFIKDYKNNNIGELINEKYNKIVLNAIIYNNNINIEYLDNFNSVKLYLDNDDKIFFLKKNENDYFIYLYSMKIGKIIYDEKKDLYKIMVYKEYKDYLNLFGFGLIFLLKS